MKNECSIVRDLLPLYVENMLNSESADFVDEHLKECPSCLRELESLKGGNTLLITHNENTEKRSDAEPFKLIMKRFRRQFYTFGYAFIIFLSFFGVGLIMGDGLALLYNILIMPVIGILGYYMLGWKSVYKIPALLFVVHLIVYACKFVDYQLLGIDFANTLIFILAFSVFELIGVAIAFLLHYALKKEDKK
jgi:hypothetical protein